MTPNNARYQQAGAPSAPPAVVDEDDGVPESFICPLTLEVSFFTPKLAVKLLSRTCSVVGFVISSCLFRVLWIIPYR